MKKRRLKNGLTPERYIQKLQEWRRERRRRRGTTGRRPAKSPFARSMGNWGEPADFQLDNQEAIINIPEVFSFIDNPDETLSVLHQLNAATLSNRVNSIFIDHNHCKQLDLCASLVMDSMLLRASDQWKFRNRKVEIRGQTSTNEHVNIMFNVSGLPKQFGFSAPLPPDIEEKIITFDLLRGHASRHPERASMKERAATSLTHYINRCLHTQGHQLNEDAQGKLLALLTEVLDNAEQHAGDSDLWQMIAYFSQMEGDGTGGVCHIVIVNYGDSLYESLHKTEDAGIRKEVEFLTEHHRGKKWFGAGRWNDEGIWALYALQEGVTRFSGTRAGQLRGNGSILTLEFFRDLAAPDARMCVTSGNVSVLFDGRYSVQDGKRGSSEGEWKVIAFNDENDLMKPPNPDYVRMTTNKFPGTLVSLRFSIQREYLEKSGKGPVCPIEK